MHNVHDDKYQDTVCSSFILKFEPNIVLEEPVILGRLPPVLAHVEHLGGQTRPAEVPAHKYTLVRAHRTFAKESHNGVNYRL